MAHSKLALAQARKAYVRIYHGRGYSLGRANGIQLVLGLRPHPQRITTAFVIEHLRAEARIRGDLDAAMLENIIAHLGLKGERRQSYKQWADEINRYALYAPTLEPKRTCDALASYLRQRSRGNTHDAVGIVARYTAPVVSETVNV